MDHNLVSNEGVVDPSKLLASMDQKIHKAKEKGFNRREIMDGNLWGQKLDWRLQQGKAFGHY